MLNIKIDAQPNDETCGATCLHAIYRHYGYDTSLEEVILSLKKSISGGTLAPYLGVHALERGFTASVLVNNMDIFDPTWFEHSEASVNLSVKLEEQLQYKPNEGISQASLAYQEFLHAGGIIKFKFLSIDLLMEYFSYHLPIITGLSATYLYNTPREYFENGKSIFDDIKGTPCGHFVIIMGFDPIHRQIVVADPFQANRMSGNCYYRVSAHRLINAILMGMITYDANLLIIQPK
ncbi:MAG: peptidase-C39 like family protein [bacterium]|nr:peptidase-C39 like family protein [bacterium]